MVKYYSETFRRKKEREVWLAKQRQRREIPRNYSFARAVLDILLDSLEQVAMIEDPYAKMRKRWVGLPASKRPERWRYNRAIKFLSKTGKIKIIKKGDEVFIELTKSGKIQALLDRLKKGIVKIPRQIWDGKWRLMIWDIPESHRLQRDQIRNFVKKLGFFQLQQSVFIIPHELPKDAVEYLKETGLINYIRFLRVDKLDYAQDLLNHFGIKTY